MSLKVKNIKKTNKYLSPKSITSISKSLHDAKEKKNFAKVFKIDFFNFTF